MQLQAEAVLGTVGILPFLEAGPLYITARQWDDVDAYARRIRAGVRRFLFKPGFVDEVELPEFDLPRVFEALARFIGKGPEAIDGLLAEKMAGFERRPAAKASVPPVVARAIQFLQLAAPRRSQQRLGRRTAITPSDLEASRFRRSFGVVDNPLVVLEDLNEGTLDRRSVHTLKQVYPATFEAIHAALFDANTDALAKDLERDIPAGKERVLGILLGTPPVAQALQRALVQAYDESAAEAQNQRRQMAARSQPDAQQTPIQRVAGL